MTLKHLSATLAALLIGLAAVAVPAKPGAFSYTQPDGSVIRLELHGDEFFHWTTIAGTNRPVSLSADGYWRETTLDKAGWSRAAQRRNAVNQKRVTFKSTHNGDVMTHGERHIPVLLVSFQDNDFTIENPATRFDALLNQTGYSVNGGTGCVRDYFVDNSHGAFTPVFDVYGPVKLPRNMVYYGGNDSEGYDSNPEQAVIDAADLLDSIIDFTKYDVNNDGYVDMMLLYYAGYNEAEHGGENTIWPHQSGVFNFNKLYDGKVIGNYFCTSELKGASGRNMCGIGTTCHEFGHSLGLPDFYDTDYEKNGKTHGLSNFSIMSGGNYNNDGRTPPYYNAEERILLGWMSDADVPLLPEGDISFASVQEDISYKTLTDTEGEYFLYECRDGKGWDYPLPQGLVVYHVDKSKNRMVGNLSPYNQWAEWYSYNTINAYGSHPCFYIVPSGDPKSLNFAGANNDYIFPGHFKVQSYTPVDWDGNDTGYTISNIKFADGKVSLTMSAEANKKVCGTVKNIKGEAISGVYIVMSAPSSASAGLRRVSAAAASGESYEALSGDDGSFSIIINGYSGSTAHLSFSKSGYETLGMDITINPRTTEVNAVLCRPGEGEIFEYSYWDPSSEVQIIGIPGENSAMAAIRVPAEDLPQKGGKISKVSFIPLWQADAYYVIVDSGSERLLTYKVPGMGKTFNNELETVDLSSLNAVFPPGKDLYIGYAVENAKPYAAGYDGYLFCISNGKNLYCDYFNLTSSDWGKCQPYALVLSASVVTVSDEQPPVDEVKSLAEMGFVSIYDPGNGSYAAGDSLPLMLLLPEGLSVLSESWTLDGSDVTGAKSVTLNAGKHKLTAKVSLSDGTKETLQLVLTAN